MPSQHASPAKIGIMKKLLPALSCFLIVCCSLQFAHGQCTPGDAESCPDPEDNGEICPDTLAPIFIDVDYEQVVTMLPPSTIDTLDLSFDLHHITLISVEGLPEGIEWVTNAENDEFMAGVYYCILFSGKTNDPAGNYPLRIVVDLYALILGEPVNVFTLTDSTSLFMEVSEEANFIDQRNQEQLITNIWPNPFRENFQLDFNSSVNGKIKLELFNLTGSEVWSEETEMANLTTTGFSAPELPPGMYFLRVTHKGRQYSRLLSKSP